MERLVDAAGMGRQCCCDGTDRHRGIVQSPIIQCRYIRIVVSILVYDRVDRPI